MSRERIIARMNTLAEEYTAMPDEGNNAARDTLRNEIFTICYKLVSDQESGPVATFFLHDFASFDPEKSTFSAFFFARFPLRVRDDYRRDHAGRTERILDEETGRKKRIYRTFDSVDRPVGETGELSLGDTVNDPGATTFFEHPDANGLRIFNQMVTAILTLPERLHGRAKNPKRIMYMRLFFTEDTTSFLQGEKGPLEIYRRSERDLLSAMRLDFLDFYLLKRARTIPEIAETPTKPHGAMVEGKDPDTPVKFPLPRDVYLAFLRLTEGEAVGSSTLSNQRTFYEDLMGKSLGEVDETTERGGERQ